MLHEAEKEEQKEKRMRKTDAEVKRKIIKIAKRMDEKGLVNAVEGNISIKKDGLVYITPTAQSKAWLTEEMIAVLDEEGRQIDGSMKYSTEAPMHLATYKKRQGGGIGSVIHCHPTFLTAHAICRKPLGCAFYPEHVVVYGTIPVAPYGQPGTDAIHEGIGNLLDESDIVLLSNHGVLAVGESIEQALATVEAAEHTAMIFAACKLVGEPVDITGEDYENLLRMRAERVKLLYK